MSSNSIDFEAGDEDIEDEPEVDPLMDISSLRSIKVEVEAFDWAKSHSSGDIELPELPISQNSNGQIELPLLESDKNPSGSQIPGEFPEINKAPESELQPIESPQQELPKGRFGLDSSASKAEVINRVMSMNFNSSRLNFEEQMLFFYKELNKPQVDEKENKIFANFSRKPSENNDENKRYINKTASLFGLPPLYEENTELCDFKKCVHPSEMPKLELFRPIQDPGVKFGKLRHFCPFMGCKRNVNEKEEWIGPGNKFFGQESDLKQHYYWGHCGISRDKCPHCDHHIRGQNSIKKKGVVKGIHVEKCEPKFKIDISEYVLENAPKILRGETKENLQKAKRKNFRPPPPKIRKVANQEEKFGLLLERKIDEESGEKYIKIIPNNNCEIQ